MCEGDAHIANLELVAVEVVAGLGQLGVRRRPALPEHKKWMLQGSFHCHLYSLFSHTKAKKHAASCCHGFQLDHGAVIYPHVGTELRRSDEVFSD